MSDEELLDRRTKCPARENVLRRKLCSPVILSLKMSGERLKCPAKNLTYAGHFVRRVTKSFWEAWKTEGNDAGEDANVQAFSCVLLVDGLIHWFAHMLPLRLAWMPNKKCWSETKHLAPSSSSVLDRVIIYTNRHATGMHTQLDRMCNSIARNLMVKETIQTSEMII